MMGPDRDPAKVCRSSLQRRFPKDGADGLAGEDTYLVQCLRVASELQIGGPSRRKMTQGGGDAVGTVLRDKPARYRTSHQLAIVTIPISPGIIGYLGRLVSHLGQRELRRPRRENDTPADCMRGLPIKFSLPGSSGPAQERHCHSGSKLSLTRAAAAFNNRGKSACLRGKEGRGRSCRRV